MHHQAVKKEHQWHANQQPKQRIGQHHADPAPRHQNTNPQRLSAEDDDGVRVVPQKVGVAADQRGSQCAPAEPEVLEGQHRKDAAEQEVNIEKNRKTEIVARQTGSDQKHKQQKAVRVSDVRADQDAVHVWRCG